MQRTHRLRPLLRSATPLPDSLTELVLDQSRELWSHFFGQSYGRHALSEDGTHLAIENWYHRSFSEICVVDLRTGKEYCLPFDGELRGWRQNTMMAVRDCSCDCSGCLSKEIVLHDLRGKTLGILTCHDHDNTVVTHSQEDGWWSNGRTITTRVQIDDPGEQYYRLDTWEMIVRDERTEGMKIEFLLTEQEIVRIDDPDDLDDYQALRWDGGVDVQAGETQLVDQKITVRFDGGVIYGEKNGRKIPLYQPLYSLSFFDLQRDLLLTSEQTLDGRDLFRVLDLSDHFVLGKRTVQPFSSYKEVDLQGTIIDL